MSVRLLRVAEVTEADRAALLELQSSVFSPEEVANWPGRHLEWSKHDWRVCVYAPGGALVTHVGVVIREGTHDGRSARIGGIGAVMTHPEARRQGHAERGIHRAIELFRDEQVRFGLLVCKPTLLDYYGRQQWCEFSGDLRIRQKGEDVPFTMNRVMTLAVHGAAPAAGVIDLCGPPW